MLSVVGGKCRHDECLGTVFFCLQSFDCLWADFTILLFSILEARALALHPGRPNRFFSDSLRVFFKAEAQLPYGRSVKYFRDNNVLKKVIVKCGENVQAQLL